jgi:hypothetical protein
MIRNYEDGSGNIILIDSTSVGNPVEVFVSSSTGGPIAGGVTGQRNAITTIAFCNTAEPDPLDENEDAVDVNIYVARNGKSAVPGNLIVSNLTIPAGETVFFNEERIILESGDKIWVGTSEAGLLAVTVSSLPV